jgi:hypothetical protein
MRKQRKAMMRNIAHLTMLYVGERARGRLLRCSGTFSHLTGCGVIRGKWRLFW